MSISLLGSDGPVNVPNSLAVKYLFLSDEGLEEHPDLYLDPFNAHYEQNDYMVIDLVRYITYIT